MESIDYRCRSLPVLHRCTVGVIGGSFAGVAAALELARTGERVVLVEPRTYLGREVTATLRYWVPVPARSEGPLPELIASCVEASHAQAVAGEYLLHPDATKTRLEDLVLGAGVQLLYASLPVAVLAGDGAIEGVIIGNKSGRQAILCPTLIDATETALVTRLAGATLAAPSGNALYRCTLEFEGAGPITGWTLAVPPALGLEGEHVTLHPGWRGEGHVLVECTLSAPAQVDTAFALTRRECLARHKAIDLAAYLIAEVPAFQHACLAAHSHELLGPGAHPMVEPAPVWAAPYGTMALEGCDVDAACCAGPLTGLWCLNEAARLQGRTRGLWHDADRASRAGYALARAIAHRAAAEAARRESACGPRVSSRQAERASRDEEAVEIREPEQPGRGRPLARMHVPPCRLPVLETADLLVVGGGSSGAVAAITAAHEGLSTILIDMNPGLGGTGTYGGIVSYWFGRCVGFAARIMELVGRMHGGLGLPAPSGTIPQWNAVAKAEALLQEAERTGVQVLLNGLAIGTIVEGNAVRGVVVATRLGPVALRADAVIDATGDGDVAAFAGAPYVYGADRDHAVMYAYMPQVATPCRPRNVKTSMVDVTDVEDYTRMILAERRRREPGDHDHGIYLAPRESRHVRADVTLTLTDQLLRRAWPDTVYIAFSNNDIKGQTTSDWLLMGLLSPNLQIEIPYRALLPQGLDGLLVAGKAFSATHDALPAIRMQADLENLGGVAALAATLALRSRQGLRDLDVRVLQARLAAMGVLPQQVLSRRLTPLHHSDEELAALVRSLDASRPLHAYSDMEIGEPYEGRVPLVDALCAGPRVIPILEEALSQATGSRRVLLAQALAILGSKAGVPILIAAIEEHLAAAHLPARESPIRHAGFPPDQAAMPDAAYLLHSLGMARDRRALPIWRRVVDRLAVASEEDLLDRQRAMYYYVEGVCVGAERLGDPAAVPILKKLHSYPPLHARTVTTGVGADYLGERLAYLELMIGRAMARCASPVGFAILISYLDDTRAILAEHALSELTAISGRDLGMDSGAWLQWLQQEAERLRPVPWRPLSEPMAAWGQEILTA